MPELSIIMPVYNVEKYLEQSVESVLKQNYKDFELICVNDGSTDNSLSLLQQLKLRDDRIRIINKENRGYGHTMNQGIDAAKGRYIGVVESDDWILPNMYETLIRYMEKENLDIVKSDHLQFITTVNGREKVVRKIQSEEKSIYYKVLNPETDKRVFSFLKTSWSGVYRTEFIRKHNIRHNESPGAAFQDNGFWFQTLSCAQRIMFINQAFYMYRVDNAYSSCRGKGNMYAMCQEYTFIREFLEKKPDRKEKFLQEFSLYKYRAYLYNLERIADEYKPEFLKRMQCEYQQSLERKEFDIGAIDDNFREKMEWVVNEPEKLLSYLRDRRSYFEKWEMIRKYDKIIIYGAGMLGQEFYRQVKEQELETEVIGFAVSDMQGNAEDLFGLKVAKIEDYSDRDTLVVIALKQEWQEGVKNKLCNLGFQKYMVYFE